MNTVISLARYKKVLLIDDDELDAYISKRVMSSALFAGEIVVKESVADGISYLKKLVKRGEALPEIIFLDLSMPGKDGFDFLDELNTMTLQYRLNIKVVILANVLSIFKNEPEKVSKYSMVRAALEKPLTPEVLENI